MLIALCGLALHKIVREIKVVLALLFQLQTHLKVLDQFQVLHLLVLQVLVRPNEKKVLPPLFVTTIATK